MAHLHDRKRVVAATLECVGESQSFASFMWGCMNHSCLSLQGKKRQPFKRMGDKCEMYTYRQTSFIRCSPKQYSMLKLLLYKKYLFVYLAVLGGILSNERLHCSFTIWVSVNLGVYSKKAFQKHWYHMTIHANIMYRCFQVMQQWRVCSFYTVITWW